MLKPLAGAGVVRSGAGDATPKSNLGSNLGGPMGAFTLGQDKSLFGQGLIASSLFPMANNAPPPGPRDEKELFF